MPCGTIAIRSARASSRPGLGLRDVAGRFAEQDEGIAVVEHELTGHRTELRGVGGPRDDLFLALRRLAAASSEAPNRRAAQLGREPRCGIVIFRGMG